MIKGSDIHVLRTLCLCYSQELALKKVPIFCTLTLISFNQELQFSKSNLHGPWTIIETWTMTYIRGSAYSVWIKD